MYHISFLAALLLPAWATATGAAQGTRPLNLGDLKWTVSNGVNATVPAKFPSQAHLDLLRAGKIQDPLYGFNDVNELWVAKSNWTYTSEPIKGLSKQKHTKTYLEFDGLDTFVEVKFCGKHVGNGANQFRQYTFEVTDILSKCSKDPVLSLNFGSAPLIVQDIAKNGPDYLKEANGYTGNLFDGKYFMRKEQNDFGWDWSPRLSPAGPWKPARVVQQAPADPVHVQNSVFDIYREGQMNNLPPDQTKPFVFNASIDFLGTLTKDAKLHLHLADLDGETIKNVELKGITKNSMTITGSATISDKDVKLWWPTGLGKQPLYQATVTVTSSQSKHSASITKRVGFRTIVLNQTPITDAQLAQGIAPGSNWHYEVNGREFYAKGSNLVPPDTFWPRVNSTKMIEIFDLAVLAGQNMLRVWSSGAYLPDFIYDLADERGLLLWSEFEFTDAMYPVLDSFLEQYEAEAYYNVRRVNHHPSLALWAGGNELELFILILLFNIPPVVEGYEKVFEELLIKCVYANTRSISYIPSSTYKGYLGEIDFNSVRPQTPRYNVTSGPDALYTDTDYYNYDGTQAFNMSNYPKGRFANEFGFIALPSLESWKEAIPSDQLYVDSDAIIHHNRHTPFMKQGDPVELSKEGYADMTSAVKDWYPLPNLSNSVANFSAWCYTSQVFQGEYYANQIAFYRRGSGLRERQLGSLYWQLNDLWVAPTWAAIEANNRPKLVYYSTKDVFQPVIIRAYHDVDADTLAIHVTSDQWETLEGNATLHWTDYRGVPIDVAPPSEGSLRPSFTVGAINSTKIASYDSLSELFTNARPASAALLRMDVQAGSHKHTSYFHPSSLKDAQLADPGLRLFKCGGGGRYKVTATKAVAAFVWLDWPSSVRGYFEDNGFWLAKGETREVKFHVWEDYSGGKWRKQITARSIWNNTRND